MKKLLSLVIITLVSTALRAQEITNYNLSVTISLEDRTVSVSGTADVDWKGEREIDFALWHNTDIKSITHILTPVDYRMDPEIKPVPYFIPDGTLLGVKRPEQAAEKSQLQFDYVCTMDSVYGWARSFAPGWVELGYHTAWFPVHPDSREFEFTLDVRFVEKLEFTGSGKEIVSTFAHTVFKSQAKTFDIVIVASEDLSRLKRRNDHVSVEIIYTDFTTREVEEIMEEAFAVYDFYTGYLDNRPEGEIKFVLQPGRFNGGGYARPYFIVLRAEKFDESLVGGIAHEMAHFWWNKAPAVDWNDWLNEAFAEYSRLIYFREKYGEETFARWIEDYREKSHGSHPVIGVDRDGPGSYETLYMKGSLILHGFENLIGSNGFMDFMGALSRQSIGDTDEFLDFIENRYSARERQWFEEKLSL